MSVFRSYPVHLISCIEYIRCCMIGAKKSKSEVLERNENDWQTRHLRTLIWIRFQPAARVPSLRGLPFDPRMTPYYKAVQDCRGYSHPDSGV